MLDVERLVKSYDGDVEGRRGRSKGARADRVLAVNDVSFSVQNGELFTLLGPSGCGKTTTLRSIAGLEDPDSGSITVGERAMFSRTTTTNINVPSNRRELGMVFQSYAIWPHMTVFDNVAFPLLAQRRKNRLSKTGIKERVDRTLETMRLGGYAERNATKLSGGQQQRLALARAIVTEPALLLLDEPLSNLDAKLRESLRDELKRLQRELGLTSIYVTHDQVEALAVSSRIAVMSDGVIEQVGRPQEIYRDPRSKFVAEFIGTANFIEGVIDRRDGTMYSVASEGGTITLESDLDVPIHANVLVSIRPEAFTISTTRPSEAANAWEGTVVSRAFLGDARDHVVAVAGRELRTRCDPMVTFAPGTSVHLSADPGSITLVPAD